MFYFIGLGLNEKSLTTEALAVLRKCKKIYLEFYTIKFPYSVEDLEKQIGRKIEKLDRGQVESERFLNDAKREDIALLVYGSPLAATTHISLLLKCKKDKIKFRILQNTGVFNAVSESGLQLYKFGKTTSLPQAKQSYEPKSFIEIVEENKRIGAHTLILVDIGLKFQDALKQLEKNLALNDEDKIVVCSCLGTKSSEIVYNVLKNLKKLKSVKEPFCFIIPGKLHFIEEEALKTLKE